MLIEKRKYRTAILKKPLSLSHYQSLNMTLAVKIILVTMGVLVVGGIIYSSIAGDNKIKNIKSNPGHSSARVFDKFIPKVTSSTVTKVKYQSRYKYEFEADGKKITGLSDRYNFYIENQDVLMNKTFPVIYDKNDPSNSCILIIDRDFAVFELPQPDSLKHFNDLLN
jgi:hypothetical protein